MKRLSANLNVYVTKKQREIIENQIKYQQDEKAKEMPVKSRKLT